MIATKFARLSIIANEYTAEKFASTRADHDRIRGRRVQQSGSSDDGFSGGSLIISNED
jgi:hypothetical protein